jgi:hypothetical protein
MVTDGLNNSTYGVSAQLVSVPTGSGEVLPTSVTAYDETRNADVAVGRYPEAWLPCLTVTLDGDVQLDGEVISGYRDATINVTIRYLTRDIEAHRGNSDVYYVLRAVQRALREFNSNANAADRTRNDVQILECQDITHINLFINIEDIYCTGAIRATFRVRDINP